MTIKLETLKYARITALILGAISILSIGLLVIFFVYKTRIPPFNINYTLWGIILFLIYVGLIIAASKTKKEIRSIDKKSFIIFTQIGFFKTLKKSYSKSEVESIQIIQKPNKFYEGRLLLKDSSNILLDTFQNKKSIESLITSIKQNIL